MLDGFDDKSAYAQTAVAFCPGPGKDPIVFMGQTNGRIVSVRGQLDFGWDPIFEPDEGGGRTYAEMSKEEKDAISHRSRAFNQLRDYMIKFRNSVLAQMQAYDVLLPSTSK
jgi:inosine triphosphate pyrophosphatase